ncbi:hypothetical protein BC938DRAFT_479831 [Jimgerdemannia flammicorona]|uniref:Uncharacterized protein n=1 Tax=Jimgerdemannia flammicorona TaxID=994334 RepID=A0A433QK19_9FUNG|nr:hypothetical protein BC938DRAFT_479831 [Jimgerdemannia flammicorona]
MAADYGRHSNYTDLLGFLRSQVPAQRLWQRLRIRHKRIAPPSTPTYPPVFDFGVLFGVFRFLNREYVNMLLTAYLSVLVSPPWLKLASTSRKRSLLTSIYKVLSTKTGKRTYMICTEEKVINLIKI